MFPRLCPGDGRVKLNTTHTGEYKNSYSKNIPQASVASEKSELDCKAKSIFGSGVKNLCNHYFPKPETSIIGACEGPVTSTEVTPVGQSILDRDDDNKKESLPLLQGENVTPVDQIILDMNCDNNKILAPETKGSASFSTTLDVLSDENDDTNEIVINDTLNLFSADELADLATTLKNVILNIKLDSEFEKLSKEEQLAEKNSRVEAWKKLQQSLLPYDEASLTKVFSQLTRYEYEKLHIVLENFTSDNDAANKGVSGDKELGEKPELDKELSLKWRQLLLNSLDPFIFLSYSASIFKGALALYKDDDISSISPMRDIPIEDEIKNSSSVAKDLTPQSSAVDRPLLTAYRSHKLLSALKKFANPNKNYIRGLKYINNANSTRPSIEDDGNGNEIYIFHGINDIVKSDRQVFTPSLGTIINLKIRGKLVELEYLETIRKDGRVNSRYKKLIRKPEFARMSSTNIVKDLKKNGNDSASKFFTNCTDDTSSFHQSCYAGGVQRYTRLNYSCLFTDSESSSGKNDFTRLHLTVINFIKSDGTDFLRFQYNNNLKECVWQQLLKSLAQCDDKESAKRAAYMIALLSFQGSVVGIPHVPGLANDFFEQNCFLKVNSLTMKFNNEDNTFNCRIDYDITSLRDGGIPVESGFTCATTFDLTPTIPKDVTPETKLSDMALFQNFQFHLEKNEHFDRLPLEEPQQSPARAWSGSFTSILRRKNQLKTDGPSLKTKSVSTSVIPDWRKFSQEGGVINANKAETVTSDSQQPPQLNNSVVEENVAQQPIVEPKIAAGSSILEHSVSTSKTKPNTNVRALWFSTARGSDRRP